MQMDHNKVYIITKSAGHEGNEFLISIGYTRNRYLVELFFDMVGEDRSYYICEEINEDSLVTTLDLYDMDIHQHELMLLTDEYNPNNYVVMANAIDDNIESSFTDAQGDLIRSMVETYFIVDKLMSVMKPPKDISNIMDKLYQYLFMIALVDGTDINLLTCKLREKGFSEEIIYDLEMNGIDAIFNEIGKYKKYYKNN